MLKNREHTSIGVENEMKKSIGDRKKEKMSTPIVDFVKKYADSDMRRLHMPGHKGKAFLGCEAYDITEIKGADALYEADGIIAESEANAAELFGSGRTVYSAEGSSQCIRAMLYLILVHFRQQHANGKRPVIVAARNVHKAFIFAATLLDFDIAWLWPDERQENSICSCIISPSQVEQALMKYGDSVAAVYVTSPDYLGGQTDICGLANICHKYGTVLAVDNAHGAYLHFLDEQRNNGNLGSSKDSSDAKIDSNHNVGIRKYSLHPLDLGADICCDSAHKTLPVLTGGAYLHINKNAPKCFFKQAKYAMGLFGSTSPSYLIMASLDLCNQYLADGYREKLEKMVKLVESSRSKLQNNGWHILDSDPLKLTIEIPTGLSSDAKADELREYGIECEYVDPDYLVFMLTPENTEEDLEELIVAMGTNVLSYKKKEVLPFHKSEQKMTIREAMFSDYEQVKVEDSLGRVCRVPTVACPPAIPVVVPGEVIGENAVRLLNYYRIEELDVVKE